MSDTGHPIRSGAILRCTSDEERCPVLVEVARRLKDIDSGALTYELTDPTCTTYVQYHQDDVDSLFVDTELTNHEHKPVLDEEIRALYQDLCEHSFHVVHDSDTLEPDGEQCINCRLRRPDR